MKNQMSGSDSMSRKNERSAAERSAERERSGKRAESAAHGAQACRLLHSLHSVVFSSLA